VKADPRAAARLAGVLVIVAAAFWWHTWMPAVAVVAFVGWVLLHTRYQGARREDFMRFRQRVWPPAPLVLVALIVTSITIYVTSTDSVGAKAMPIALNLVAVGAVILGKWRQVAASSS
jgi:hypothetical protein